MVYAPSLLCTSTNVADLLEQCCVAKSTPLLFSHLQCQACVGGFFIFFLPSRQYHIQNGELADHEGIFAELNKVY